MSMFATRFELIGRIGRSQVREVGERKVVQLAVAVDREYKDEEGNRPTDWFDVELWSGNAEKLAELLTKGRLVFLSGKMRQKIRERTAQTDSGEEASYTEYGIRLVADDFRLLSTPKVEPDEGDKEESERSSAKPQISVRRTALSPSSSRPSAPRQTSSGSGQRKGYSQANGYARKSPALSPVVRRAR